MLAAYHSGLKLPDDITLHLAGRYFGYVRHLPDAAERARGGGNGVYYHISYWGGPASYLWLATMHPALMWEELEKSYALDARRIWILNVGDIKPGEYLTQLFSDMAFDPGAYPDLAAVRAHLKAWRRIPSDPNTRTRWRTFCGAITTLRSSVNQSMSAGARPIRRSRCMRRRTISSPMAMKMRGALLRTRSSRRIRTP